MGKLFAGIGSLGASLGALCCFTGLLPFVLTAIGAGSMIGTLYRDSVLFPFVGISLIIMGIGIWIMRKNRT